VRRGRRQERWTERAPETPARSKERTSVPADLPTLQTTDPLNGRELTIAFGCFNGAPTAALFLGADGDPILLDRAARPGRVPASGGF